MPLPFRIGADPDVTGPSLVIQAQTGQPAAPGEAVTSAVPPGSAETEGAFGVFGMMVSGLIILFAVVLLVRKARSRR